MAVGLLNGALKCGKALVLDQLWGLRALTPLPKGEGQWLHSMISKVQVLTLLFSVLFIQTEMGHF